MKRCFHQAPSYRSTDSPPLLLVLRYHSRTKPNSIARSAAQGQRQHSCGSKLLCSVLSIRGRHKLYHTYRYGINHIYYYFRQASRTSTDCQYPLSTCKSEANISCPLNSVAEEKDILKTLPFTRWAWHNNSTLHWSTLQRHVIDEAGLRSSYIGCAPCAYSYGQLACCHE